MWSCWGTGRGWGRKPSGCALTEQSLNPPGYGFENSAQGRCLQLSSGEPEAALLQGLVQRGGLTVSSKEGTHTGAAAGLGPSTEVIDWVMQKSITEEGHVCTSSLIPRNLRGFEVRAREINSLTSLCGCQDGRRDGCPGRPPFLRS